MSTQLLGQIRTNNGGILGKPSTIPWIMQPTMLGCCWIVQWKQSLLGCTARVGSLGYLTMALRPAGELTLRVMANVSSYLRSGDASLQVTKCLGQRLLFQAPLAMGMPTILRYTHAKNGLVFIDGGSQVIVDHVAILI